MYCTIEDIKHYLEPDLVNDIETAYHGRIDKQIEMVSSEIDDLLGQRYRLPIDSPPAALVRCAAVLAAHRTLGGITGVIDKESMENSLSYLGKQAESVNKMLNGIADGKIKLGLAEAEAEKSTTDNELLITSRPQQFDLSGY